MGKPFTQPPPQPSGQPSKQPSGHLTAKHTQFPSVVLSTRSIGYPSGTTLLCCPTGQPTDTKKSWISPRTNQPSRQFFGNGEPTNLESVSTFHPTPFPIKSPPTNRIEPAGGASLSNENIMLYIILPIAFVTLGCFARFQGCNRKIANLTSRTKIQYAAPNFVDSELGGCKRSETVAADVPTKLEDIYFRGYRQKGEIYENNPTKTGHGTLVTGTKKPLSNGKQKDVKFVPKTLMRLNPDKKCEIHSKQKKINGEIYKTSGLRGTHSLHITPSIQPNLEKKIPSTKSTRELKINKQVLKQLVRHGFKAQEHSGEIQQNAQNLLPIDAESHFHRPISSHNEMSIHIPALIFSEHESPENIEEVKNNEIVSCGNAQKIKALTRVNRRSLSKQRQKYLFDCNQQIIRTKTKNDGHV